MFILCIANDRTEYDQAYTGKIPYQVAPAAWVINGPVDGHVTTVVTAANLPFNIHQTSDHSGITITSVITSLITKGFRGQIFIRRTKSSDALSRLVMQSHSQQITIVDKDTPLTELPFDSQYRRPTAESILRNMFILSNCVAEGPRQALYDLADLKHHLENGPKAAAVFLCNSKVKTINQSTDDEDPWMRRHQGLYNFAIWEALQAAGVDMIEAICDELFKVPSGARQYKASRTIIRFFHFPGSGYYSWFMAWD